MSVIFQDPFMSEEQSFDKLLMELDYTDANIESSIWQQYLSDFEEDLKPAVWQKYVDLKPLDINFPASNNLVEGVNANKDSNDHQLDALIEEIVSLSPVQPQEGQTFRNELSQMLQTEPSTLTVLDKLVNTSSEQVDFDKYQEASAPEPPSSVHPSHSMPYPKERAIPVTPIVSTVRENAPKTLPTRLRRCNSYASESSESSHYSSEDETIQNLSSDDDVTVQVSKSKRSPAKPKRKRYYKTRKPRLCQYLAELLNNPERNPSMMEWVDREEGIFRFTDSGAVARMWGQRRHKPDMKYENFARSLRTYIAKGVLRKLRSKLVYGFSIPSNWINISQS